MILSKIYSRTIYLAYYLKQLDKSKFNFYLSYVAEKEGKLKFFLLLDVVKSSFKYNIGLIDYFYFRFYEKSDFERSKWVGTGFKYEYDLIMNPVKNRHILQNKIEFFSAFGPFVKHAWCTLSDLKENNERFKKVFNSGNKLAVKDALGQCGWDVEIIKVDDFTPQSLATYMQGKGFNLLEEFIIQHDELKSLSDTGLNTVRVITQINPEGGVDIIGPTLRITVNSSVDNMAVGNIAAQVDLETGKVIGPGVYQDITKQEENTHPVTGKNILGFQIPFWKETLELCRQAALYNTQNKSIGWDVAITQSGPSFVEGNHNWCKILWQLPAREGLKHQLLPYLKSAKSGNPIYK